MNILRKVEIEVNELHEKQMKSSFDKDFKTILKACKQHFPESDVIVQHLCTREGKTYFGLKSAQKNSEKVLIPCVYELIAPVGMYSESLWYKSYIAQGRLLDYLLKLKRKLSDHKGSSVTLTPIRHLYCATIMCLSEPTDSAQIHTISTDLQSPQLQAFLKNHFAIYKRRFSTEIQEWKKYTTLERITSGDCLGDFFEYYNNGFLDILQ